MDQFFGDVDERPFTQTNRYSSNRDDKNTFLNLNFQPGFPSITHSLCPTQRLFEMFPDVAGDALHCTWSPNGPPQVQKPSEPLNLNISFDISSTKLIMRWIIQNEFALRRNVHYILEINETDKDTNRYQKFSVSWRAFTEMVVVPGRKYDVTVRCIENGSKTVLATGFQKIKAVFSVLEGHWLFKRAVQFASSQMQPFRYLFRCKPQVYWDDIRFNFNSVMMPYEKDTSGQPANRINEEISGLVFNARTLPDDSLPTRSAFGDVRMQIDAWSLMNPEKFNIYFADFYCNQKFFEYTTKKRNHHVTILVALKSSASDSFASRNLLSLNIYQNPFIKYDIERKAFVVNTSVWVEIFFTERIPLHWGYLENVSASGSGSSKLGESSNNKICETCNIYSSNRKKSGEEKLITKDHPHDKQKVEAPYNPTKREETFKSTDVVIKSLIPLANDERTAKKRKLVPERDGETSEVKRAHILEVNSSSSSDSRIIQGFDNEVVQSSLPPLKELPGDEIEEDYDSDSATASLYLDEERLLICLDEDSGDEYDNNGNQVFIKRSEDDNRLGENEQLIEEENSLHCM